MEFTSFDLPPDLLRGVSELGFTRPTTIQEQAIPPAMAGRDLLACAATGSGKTAAFLLPIIRRLMTQPRGKTRALILTPTRELAAQIHQHLEELAVHTRITGAAIYGGVGMGPQEQAFRKGVDILIATPGRLLDHMQNPYARLDSLELLVLDEADRMLDMGFLPDIRRVLKQIPQKRQTLFFSATMPQPIVKLSQEMLSDPATINLERKAAPASGITQALYPVPADLKSALFLELLRRDEIRNAIVFLRTKHRTNRLFDQLERAGVPVARIHGNRSQAQRTEALAGFKSGKYRILVATDIVARGIDVEALEHVVNFDVPAAPEDYIHRVGRTARAEAIGDAITFVSPEEEGDLRAIERAIGRAIPRVTVPDFDYRQRAGERFEVPLAERIAAIRARKAEERARSRAKSERASQVGAEQGARTGGGSGSGGSGGSGAGRRRRGGRGRGTGGGAPRQG
jgi:ATP-dependent RNA helicase RhlE